MRNFLIFHLAPTLAVLLLLFLLVFLIGFLGPNGQLAFDSVKYLNKGVFFASLKTEWFPDEFGRSLISAIQVSLPIWASAILLTIVISLGGGLWLLLIENHLLGITLKSFLMLIYRIPIILIGSFLLGFTYQYLPSFKFHLGTPEQITFKALLSHFALPILCYSIAFSPFTIIQCYGFLRTESEKNYALALRARGVSNFQLFLRHYLPNLRAPLLALIQILCTNVILLSLAIEPLFALQGFGSYLNFLIRNHLALPISLVIVFLFLIEVSMTGFRERVSAL